LNVGILAVAAGVRLNTFHVWKLNVAQPNRLPSTTSALFVAQPLPTSLQSSSNVVTYFTQVASEKSCVTGGARHESPSTS